mgnify:CR=1 FL=1
MIEDAKRSIAFLCPVCRQPVILERTVFQLAASGSRLPCPCGKSALTVSLMGDQVRLTVPCLFCEQEHTVSCSTAAFLQEKTLAFSCANSGLDCCYVGEEASVFAAMRRLEETVDVLESEAGWRPGNLSQRPGDGGNPGRTAGHWPAGRHLLYLRMQGVEAEDQLQFGGAVLRPVRRCAETPCGDHVGH